MIRRRTILRLLCLAAALGAVWFAVEPLPAQRPFRTLRHGRWTREAAFTPDGRYLLTSGMDWGPVTAPRWSVKLWDTRTWRPVRILSGALGLCGFSADGGRLLTGSEDGGARLWDTRTWRSTVMPRMILSGDDPMAVLSPDGTRVAYQREHGSALKVVHVATGRVLRQRPFASGITGFSADGRSLAYWCVGWGGGGFYMLEISTGRVTFNGWNALAFSPSGRVFAVEAANGNLEIWSVSPRRRLRAIRGIASWPPLLVFSPDGRMLAGVPRSGPVQLWDTASGLRLLSLDQGPCGSLAFSPNGDVLATTNIYGVRLWRLPSRNYLAIKARLRRLGVRS